MKFCSKCGNEIMDETVICPGCGCAVDGTKSTAPKQTYAQAIQCSTACAIVSVILLVLGIAAALIVNVLIGAVLCLVAEIISVIPNSRVQKLFKQNNAHIIDKKILKNDEKALRKELKKANGAYAFCSVISIISPIGVIVFALMI